jgi:3-dehydroquinate synthase
MNVQAVTVNIKLQEQKNYPIIIGESLLEQAGMFFKKHTKAKKLAVITNNTVYPLYGKIIENSLKKEGFECKFIILEDGEKYKNAKTLQKIWDESLKFKLERKDAFVALGGGVVGDITGFAAATYLRGIDFVQIPTTLLAQVDSSVGGKVGINHELGKNMLGAFYQPELVLADVTTLNTLPVEQLKTGLAEVLKYGFIEKTCGYNGEPLNLIKWLKNNKDNVFNLHAETMSKLIKYCCELKAVVVNQDEKEAGLRAILNFGHTIGHAVEKCTNYEVFTHGQAVAIGMQGVLGMAKEMNLIEEEYFNNAINLIDLYGLKYKIPENVSKQDIIEAMKHDKKVISNKVRFVMPVNEGVVEILDNIEEETVLKAVDKLY